MNFFTLMSFSFAAVVFGYSVIGASDNPKSFVDVHAFVIVIAGTVACAAISYQFDRVLLMIKVFFNRMVRGKKANYRETILELMKIADAYRNGADMKPVVGKIKDDFLREAISILLDGVIEMPSLRRVLTNRMETIYMRYNSDAKMFQGMGKFPPAMGLMGAVLGMIALLGGLGKPGAEKTVGPAMSVALVATFYGIAFANLFVIPIGENLTDGAKELKIKNKIIVEGILLIAKKTNPVVLAEELNSFLLPKERVDRKTIQAASKGR